MGPPTAVQQAVLDDSRDGGVSQRELARRHGISKETVRVIINRGRVNKYVKREPVADPFDPVCVPDYRCGGCGRKVNLEPCQICRAMQRDNR